MKIIIYGGCFDPIHLGHIEVAKAALNQIGANYLFFVPSKNVEYKEIIANPIDRYEMIKLACSSISPFFKVSNFEIASDAMYSYSYKTVKYFRTMFPDDELYFLIGSDQLEGFSKWKKYHDILTDSKLLVYPRSRIINHSLLQMYNATKIEGKLYTEESSSIRDEINFNALDDKVKKYILDNNVYTDFILKKYLSEKRYLHSMRVAKYMVNIFKNIEPSLVNQAYLAGIYHDICKEFDKLEIESISYYILHLKNTHYEILHGPVASYFLKQILGINEQLVLNAIARHTKPFDYGTGPLSLLDMALYCCDKLEPLRTDQDVKNINYFRNLLEKDIKQCFLELYSAIEQQYS